MQIVEENSLDSATKKPALKRRYHHGDLRAALVATGLKMLASTRVEDFSLREVARDIGVSVAAIYRHFPDKTAMFQALALEGIERLGLAQLQASEAAGGGVKGFSASGRAYVRFALANPSLFRLIMSHAMVVDTARMSSDSASLAMRLLIDSVQALVPQASATEVRIHALRAWSEVHGLTMLMLEKQVPQDDSLIDVVVDAQKYAWLT